MLVIKLIYKSGLEGYHYYVQVKKMTHDTIWGWYVSCREDINDEISPGTDPLPIGCWKYEEVEIISQTLDENDKAERLFLSRTRQ